MHSQCYWWICFVHLPKDSPKFFGFAEYLAAVALMALAWTIADVRYKFRVATAPIPLQFTTYWVVGAVGLLTLVTDWWRAEQWLVPAGYFMTPASWQAFLGFVFLLNFLVWVWFAFVRPPVYNGWNAYRFGRALYRVVLRGAPSELPEISDELARSARALIKNAWQSNESDVAARSSPKADTRPSRSFQTRQCAYEILLMIADRKFCRHAVISAPIIALALFEEVKAQKRFQVPLGTFAKNFTAEAIANKDSFAYHEIEGYYTGFVGYQKPITRALYGDFRVIASLKSIFDVPFEDMRRWDADQWGAFCRLLLVTIEDYVGRGAAAQSSAEVWRAIDSIENSVSSLFAVNGASFDAWDSVEVKKLDVACKFALDFMKILDKHPKNLNVAIKRRKEDHNKDVCDMVANLMFELIFAASSIKKPRDLCWFIQHNYVWDTFFGKFSADGHATRIVRFKLSQLLRREVREISRFPHMKNTRYLGLMLNVMGLREHRADDTLATTRFLHRAVLRWTVRNYARLAAQRPTVAENALVEGITYDPQGPSLIFTREPVLDRKIEPVVLKLDPFIGADDHSTT